MKRKFFAFVCLLVFASIGSAHGDMTQALGQWQTVQEENGFTFTLGLDIQVKTTTVSNICSYRGQSLQVAVKVPSQLTNTQLIIKGNAKTKKKVGNLTCDVGAVKANMDYQVSGDSIFFSQQGQTVEFTRVR